MVKSELINEIIVLNVRFTHNNIDTHITKNECIKEKKMWSQQRGHQKDRDTKYSVYNNYTHMKEKHWLQITKDTYNATKDWVPRNLFS